MKWLNEAPKCAPLLIAWGLAVVIADPVRGEIIKGDYVFLDDAFADNATLVEGE